MVSHICIIKSKRDKGWHMDSANNSRPDKSGLSLTGFNSQTLRYNPDDTSGLSAH
jgi:hypothetical protein